jgi:hypothetical protein
LLRKWILKEISSCVWVTVEGVWIGNPAHWTLLHTTSHHTSQITTTHRLLLQSRLHYPLLGNGFRTSDGGRSPSLWSPNYPRISVMVTPATSFSYKLYRSLQHTRTIAQDSTQQAD